jgi:AcrR family transcriptional regulator
MATRTLRPLARRGYHFGDLRQALIDTALELIEIEGVRALTIRELARRLGVSHAAPAHHFRSAAALLVELATQGFNRFAEALERAADGAANPADRMARIGSAYLCFALEHPAYLRIMFGPHPDEVSVPPPELARAGARAYSVLEEAAEALVSEAGGDPASVPFVAFSAWSLVHGASQLWIDGSAQFQFPGESGRERFLADTDTALRRYISALTATPGGPSNTAGSAGGSRSSAAPGPTAGSSPYGNGGTPRRRGGKPGSGSKRPVPRRR